MLGQAIKFTAKYKKYRAASQNCTAKEAKTLAERVKYFRHDGVVAFGIIEEEVPGELFKEFTKERKVAGAWKNVKWSFERQFGAWVELEELVKRAGEFEKKLQKLKDEIDKEWKPPAKGEKPDKDLEKLQNQIEDDLKEMKVIAIKFKKVKPCDKDLEKEFAKEIKSVETADPGATKFGKALKKHFEKGVLKKTTDKCQKSLDKAKIEAETAINAAKQGSAREAEVFLKACNLRMKKILEFEKKYSKMGKSFEKDIKDHEDRKMIDDAIEKFVDLKKDIEKLVSNATAEVKKGSR